jgi:hypothetical protein
MAQIEIFRGNIMIGYKLFMEALKYLNPDQDASKIEYINSFIMAHKPNILKAIEYEKIIESNKVLNQKQFDKAVKELYLIESIDKRYSDLIDLKLISLFCRDPMELILMSDEVYSKRKNNIKLAIYYLDLVFTHKDLVKMVQLREEILCLLDHNE